MSNHILDASAMPAYLSSEPGEHVVTKLLTSSSAVCYAHTMNLCEVYYQLIRQTSVRCAHQGIAGLFADGIIERHDVNRKFWRRVGELKAHGKISLPDCFCISLAQVLGGEVVTTDMASSIRSSANDRPDQLHSLGLDVGRFRGLVLLFAWFADLRRGTRFAYNCMLGRLE